MTAKMIQSAGSGLSKGLQILALLAGLAVPISIAHTIQRQHTHALADAETRAANTAHALDEHAARIFENIDTYLRAVASLVGPRTGKLPEAAMHDALREQVGRSRLFNISIIDRDGRAIVEAGAFPARPLDVKDRTYFQMLRNRPGDALGIGDPIIGRLTGKLLIPVGRRIEGPDGTFAGIVQGMFDPRVFEDVYHGIDNGPGAVLTLWHTDGTLLVRSPSMPSVIGRNYAEGENYRHHVVPRDEKPFWSVGSTDGMERVFALGFLEGYPLFVGAAIGRDDALATWRQSAITLAAGGGGLTLVLVAALLMLAREIERRQSADASIRISEERYRLLADNTSDLIVFKPTMLGRRGYVSPAVKSILGWEPEEYAALPSTDIVHPDEIVELSAIYGALSPERSQATHVHRLRHKAGHYVWIESVFKLVGRDPQDTTVVVSGRDVTARRATDMALRDSEERYRTLAENTSDVIICLNAELRRTYVSPSCERLFGYTPDEMLDVQPATFLHPEDLAAVREQIRSLMIGSVVGQRVVMSYRVRHKFGPWIWVEATLDLARGENGAPDSIVGVLRDISARKADEATLIRAREAAEQARIKAEEADRTKGEFLATMSHEIRTPLNAIKGFNELLADDSTLSLSQRGYVARVHSACDALIAVVDDVLDYARIEAGGISLEREPFAPRGLISETVAMVQGLADAKELRLSTSIASDLPDWLVGDITRLRQVLLNLLNNAIKFTGRGSVTVTVGYPASSRAACLEVAIRDTGIGIEPEAQARLFTRFSQADGSTARRFGGSGLGLAICKGLVEAMSGEIGLVSEVGVGSTFKFTVPLAPSKAPQPQMPTAVRPAVTLGAQTGSKGRLLLVDDEETNRVIGRAVLERGGYSVDLVSNGLEAFGAVLSGTYDLVLMDVQMPEMDGMTATKAIRALAHPAHRLPIIAMTANVMPHQVAQFREAGMNDHVGKPFEREHLFAVIELWVQPPVATSTAADGRGVGHRTNPSGE